MPSVGAQLRHSCPTIASFSSMPILRSTSLVVFHDPFSLSTRGGGVCTIIVSAPLLAPMATVLKNLAIRKVPISRCHSASLTGFKYSDSCSDLSPANVESTAFFPFIHSSLGAQLANVPEKLPVSLPSQSCLANPEVPVPLRKTRMATSIIS